MLGFSFTSKMKPVTSARSSPKSRSPSPHHPSAPPRSNDPASFFPATNSSKENTWLKIWPRKFVRGKGDQFKANVSQHNIKSSHQKNDGSGRWSFPFETVFFQGHSLMFGVDKWSQDLHKSQTELCLFDKSLTTQISKWMSECPSFFSRVGKNKGNNFWGSKKNLEVPKPPIFAECLLQPTQIQIILQKFTAKFWPSCCARETAPSTFHKTQGISNVFQPKKGFNITKPSQNHRETKVFHISCGQILAPFTWPTFHWIHYPWHPSHMHLAGGLLCRNLGSLASFVFCLGFNKRKCLGNRHPLGRNIRIHSQHTIKKCSKIFPMVIFIQQKNGSRGSGMWWLVCNEQELKLEHVQVSQTWLGSSNPSQQLVQLILLAEPVE